MSTNFKNLLKDKIIKKLTAGHCYFSHEQLCALLSSQHLCVQPHTLNRYLWEFCKQGVLYSCGRGWYSSIRQPFELDLRPVKKTIELLKKKYPLLSFSLWSTEQLKSYAHHMLTKFVTFVYTDRDAMPGVSDFLKDSGYIVWLNPRGNDTDKFTIEAKTIVIRPAISREPTNGNFAGIEKVIVDIFVEADILNLMDEDECYRIFKNILEAGRVSMGTLLNYARRRKLKKDEFLNQLKSI